MSAQPLMPSQHKKNQPVLQTTDTTVVMQDKGVRDPRLFPVMAAFLCGPVGLWWWGKQQPEKPDVSMLLSLTTLWIFQFTFTWWLLPPVGRLKQPGWYALLFANLVVISWLFGVMLAPEKEQAWESSYWWGYGLHILLLELWLVILHPLTAYTPFPVAQPIYSIGIPTTLGMGWVISLRQALGLQRQPSFFPNPRIARVLGWLLSFVMGTILLLFLYIIRYIVKLR